MEKIEAILEDDEKILFELNSTINEKNFKLNKFFSAIFLVAGITIILNLVILVLFYGLLNLLNNLASYFLILIGLIFLVLGIFSINHIIKVKNTEYFITSKKVIKLQGKGLLTCHRKRKEIHLDDIIYIVEYENYTQLVKRDGDIEITQILNEADLKNDIRKRKHYINVVFSGEEGEKKVEEFLSYLIKQTSMFKHLDLDYLYLSPQIKSHKKRDLSVNQGKQEKNKLRKEQKKSKEDFSIIVFRIFEIFLLVIGTIVGFLAIIIYGLIGLLLFIFGIFPAYIVIFILIKNSVKRKRKLKKII